MESPRLGDSPDGATDSDVPEIELIIKVFTIILLRDTRFLEQIGRRNNNLKRNFIFRHLQLTVGEKELAYFVMSTLWTYTCWQSLKRSP